MLFEVYQEIIKEQKNQPDIGDELYCEANPELRNKIDRRGLKPVLDEYAKNMGLNFEAIIAMNFDEWDTASDMDYDVWKINTKGLDNNWSKSYINEEDNDKNDWFVFTIDPVPRNQMEMVHKGSGKNIN